VACTAETSALNAGYPTSSDCPPSPSFAIGTIPVGATLTTGTARAEGKPTGGVQTRVFCGYCRDSDGTLAFAAPPFECDSDADCAPVAPTFEACEQRNNGAFGPAGGAVKTITMTGAVPGCLADGLTHPGTVAAGMCIAPTFNRLTDNSADFPGPAAFSLKGTFQLQ